MKTLITITRNGDAIRISKVTAHGEEVLEADVEAKSLAILLWGKLAQDDPQGGATLLPWHTITPRLDSLTEALTKLSVALDKHSHLISSLPAPAQPTPVTKGQ